MHEHNNIICVRVYTMYKYLRLTVLHIIIYACIRRNLVINPNAYTYYIILLYNKNKKLNKPATAVRMYIQINGVCVGSLNPIE